jgi:hypothetical protein
MMFFSKKVPPPRAGKEIASPNEFGEMQTKPNAWAATIGWKCFFGDGLPASDQAQGLMSPANAGNRTPMSRIRTWLPSRAGLSVESVWPRTLTISDRHDRSSELRLDLSFPAFWPGGIEWFLYHLDVVAWQIRRRMLADYKKQSAN